MTKCLVTGGAGFIGSHLVTRLVADGFDVRVFDNLCTGSLENLAHLEGQFEFQAGSVADRSQVQHAVEGMEIVFHEAALASVPLSVEHPMKTHDACVNGTLQVLDCSRLAGVKRVVYAASSSAYGNEETLPKHENLPPEVLSPYAAAKLAGELYCQSFADSYDIETVRLRYFNVFGPKQDPASPYSAVIPLFVAALLSGKQPTFFGDGTQSRDFIYIDNVVEANILASQAEGVSGNVYNVATGTSLNLIDLLQEICQLLDKPYDPNFAEPRAGDVLHSWADISAAERELGYSPKVDMKEGLRRTVEYYADFYS